jgi:bifunctional non-homologous end joining protein LigD
MKGTAGDLPTGNDWVYELKWDGMRLIAHIDDTGARLQSSNGRDVTASFPDLAGLAELGEGYDGLVLDGEVVAFADGRPSFGALQQRMHITDPAEAARRASDTPVIYVVFDLLWLDGHDTTSLPLRDRRALLEQVVEPGPAWRRCEQHHDDPQALLDTVAADRLEGLMAKRTDSTYQPGRRSTSWIKIKPRQRQEFVVAGWLSGRGRRAAGLGSLLVGYYDGSELRYAGSAGSGLTDATISEWQHILVEQPSCPFAEAPPILRDGRTVHWCRPDQVVEIAFGEWPDEQQLRHPVVLGRRTDKDPADVRRES